MASVKLTANGFTVYAPTLEEVWQQIADLVEEQNSERFLESLRYSYAWNLEGPEEDMVE